MAPVRFCSETERAQLFQEFLHEPGVWESLLQDLEEVKRLSVETPCSEQDFQPIYESTHLSMASLKEPLSLPISSPLPPMSPRTPRTPEPASEVSSPFFLERNIDQIPERNLVSPRTPLTSETAVRVPVIRQTPESCRPSSAADHSEESVETNKPTLQDITTSREASQGNSLLTSNEDARSLGSSPQPSISSCDERLVSPSVSPSVTASSSNDPTTPSQAHQYVRKTTPFRSVIQRNELLTNSMENVDPAGLSHQETVCPTLSCLPPLLPSFLPVQVLCPSLVSTVQRIFSSLPNDTATISTVEPLCKALDLPVLMNSNLLYSVYGEQMQGGCAKLLSFWQQHSNLLLGKDRLFHLLKSCNGSNVVKATDLFRLVSSVLSQHSQLEFFRSENHRGMHVHYIDSVVSSLLWQAGGWRLGEINLRQFNSLNLGAVLDMLQDPGQDLNLVPHFSYDQFYVAYVKFVQLDISACGSLGPRELLDYECGQLGSTLTERIFSRILLNSSMQFKDWVFFLLAQVDTGCRSSLDYWFAVLDTDDDGFLCLGELHPFYKDALEVLLSCGVVSWDHLSAQLLDTTGPPKSEKGWTRGQLRTNAKMAHLINAFINIFKFALEDENDVVIRSSISPIAQYVARALQEIEGY